MRGIVFLVLLLLWCQEIKGKETIENSGVGRYTLSDTKYALQKRSVSDIWNSIKNTSYHSWEYIKNMSNITRKRLADWITKIRESAHDLDRAFEERLNKIKKDINEVIKQVKVTDELVKKCLQNHKEQIDEILKNIVFEVTNCVSNSLNQLNNLAALQYAPIPNRTDFLNDIQNDVDKCMKEYKEPHEVEECISNTRNNIYLKVGITEASILENHTQKRRASDELLNTIVECTTDGIIKSTTVVANETIHIIECVAKGSKLTQIKEEMGTI